MRIARGFPVRTTVTPADELSFVGNPCLLLPLEVDEVHISVSFTWDIPRAERLMKEWRAVAPVKIGGPGIGMRGENFEPGKYLRPGYTITSRGCNNRCWFCSVWKREGKIRELPMTGGNIVLDDNLLACSDDHIMSVFAMLAKQKHKADFRGGLEAALLKEWHVKCLIDLNCSQIFFAYDTPNDKEPLFEAGRLFKKNGWNMVSQVLRCYVLIGYPRDTFEAAKKRLYDTVRAGFMPYAMLYRNEKGIVDHGWLLFRWYWSSHRLVPSQVRKARIEMKLDPPNIISRQQQTFTFDEETLDKNIEV